MVRVAVAEIDRDLDPLPAFGGDLLGFGRQLLGGQAIEQGDVLEPTAIVVLEQVAQDSATGGFIGSPTPTNRARRSEARTALSVSWRRIRYGSLL